MRCHCVSTRSFFCRPDFDAETLRSYEFFLVYHGKGYTLADVQGMYIDELIRRVTQLRNQLEEEAQMRKQEMLKLKSQQASQRARMKMRR